MSRVTDTRFLRRHRASRRIWLNHQILFAYLSFTDQRVLHEYYQPAVELSDLVLLAHRRRISRERPSLPQRAGKAYAHLTHAVWQTPATITIKGPGQRPRTLSARGLVRSEIDIELIARAIFNQALMQMEPQPSSTSRPTDEPPLPEPEAPAAPSTSPPPPPQPPDDYPSHPDTAPPSDPGPSG